MIIGQPEEAGHLSVYQYHFLDDLSFIRRPEDVFDESEKGEIESFVAAVKDRFREAGWEGDGEIGIIWLPPFADVGTEDTTGTYFWHVKQSNNGTSWLACNVSLNFRRLREQNERSYTETHIPAGIMHIECLGLKRRTEKLLASLSSRLNALNSIKDAIAGEISSELVTTAQGDLVAQLNVFLDGCYLNVLMEVLQSGNTSRLQLAKFKASLAPVGYLPNDDTADQYDAEAGQWFTTQGLISDIWRSYKFEPFQSKLDMLFDACNYKAAPQLQYELKKHILLRNCVQHHERQLTGDSLRKSGVNQISLLGPDGAIHKFKANSTISFSLPELNSFGHHLTELAASFDEHTRKRIRTIAWVPRSDAS
jgi:hypothetical protein